MAQVFTQALGGEAQADPYELIMQELQKSPRASKPMYTSEQIEERIRVNNAMVNLGLIGAAAGDKGLNEIGGAVLKKSLAARDPHYTSRGSMDPLTGETAVSPEWQEMQDESRRAKIFQLALASQSRREQREQAAELARQRTEDQKARDRQLAQDRLERDAARAEDRQAQIRLAASMRAGVDPQLSELRQGLIQAQTDAARERIQTSQDKREEKANKLRFLAEKTVSRADSLIKEVDDATKLVGMTTTGLVGAGARHVPGTDAYRLNRIIDTLKANIGFQELQDMRQMSSTGGALGQVAIKELEFLQAVLGSLDTAQDPKTVRANLKKIRTHYENIKNDMRGKLGEASPSGGATDIATPPGAAPPSAPRPAATPSQMPPPGARGGAQFLGFEPPPGAPGG